VAKKVSTAFKTHKKSVQEEVQDVKLRFEAEKKLKQAGIPAPIQPKASGISDFPNDVTEIPHSDLGMYLGQYESMAAWIGYEIAQKEIDLDHAKILLDYVYGQLLSKGGEGKASEQKARVAGNEFYLQCRLEYTEIEADLRILRASLDTYERYARTISREITNRKAFTESFPVGRTGTGI
jgi:hypothetical protein